SFTGPPSSVIYTLSLHDALPIYGRSELIGAADAAGGDRHVERQGRQCKCEQRRLVTGVRARDLGRVGRAEHDRGVVVTVVQGRRDRKSTRLNSSHVEISYAVFCL